MNVLPEYIIVHYMPAWCELRTEEGAVAKGTAVTGGCVPSCVLWALNLNLLKEQ